MYNPAPFIEYISSYPISTEAFPPGLLGHTADLFFRQSPRPVRKISLAASIAFCAGVFGRQYNVSNTGLNQYIFMLSDTGTGKDVISSGPSKLISFCRQRIPTMGRFIGGDPRSDAAWIKQIPRQLSALYMWSEAGFRLEQMHGRRPNPNYVAIKRVALEVYSKSGQGNVFQPILYSDSEKSSEPALSPAVSIIGECTPEKFFEVVDEALISSGLLPRFLTSHFKGDRPDLNEYAASIFPSEWLVESWYQAISKVNELEASNQVINVGLTNEAVSLARDFNIYCDYHIRGSGEVSRQMYSRAYLKAVKLAALGAVGANQYAPMIDHDLMIWAIKIVLEDVQGIIGRFNCGQVGEVDGNEVVQRDTLIATIKDYVTYPHRFAGYHGTDEMREARVFSLSFLQAKLLGVKAFKGDPRLGASKSLERAIKQLLDGDLIREIPRKQMVDDFQTGARAYMVTEAFPVT